MRLRARTTPVKLSLALSGALGVLIALRELAGNSGPIAAILPRDADPLVGLIPLALCIARSVLVRRERWGWAGLSGAILFSAVGGTVAFALTVPGHQLPVPSPADAFWLLRYPLLYLGFAVLLKSRTVSFRGGEWLDGLIGACAAGALLSVLVAGPILAHADRSGTVTTIFELAYPLADVLVVGFVFGAVALNGWQLRAWAPLAVGVLAFAISEGVDTLHALNHSAQTNSGVTDPGYLLCAWLIAYAAWRKPDRTVHVKRGARPIAIPVLCAAAATGLLVYSAFEPANPITVAFAALSLAGVLIRQARLASENAKLLETSRAEAITDPLTGLGNRRALTADLALAAREAERRPVTLVSYDLDGFKHYNDQFGHPAGDDLLSRLGRKLSDTVAGRGRAYRPGGDEFCLLLDGDGAHETLVLLGAEALSERGGAFTISASHGSVLMPHDTADADEALRIADQRMYQHKGKGRRDARREHASAALLQLVREQNPALSEHTHGVSDWAAGTARRLGASEATVEQARLGGDLHDIGKTAIPKSILDKPGPLTDLEWVFMRRHTIIGERILLADPDLAHVAAVARSHHERYDGSGYPDGVAGDAIPLAARIVAVCDAYEAITAERPYSAARSHEEAVAELRRCAATHFDPAVVEAFIHTVGRTGEVAAPSGAGAELPLAAS